MLVHSTAAPDLCGAYDEIQQLPIIFIVIPLRKLVSYEILLGSNQDDLHMCVLYHFVS